MTNAERDAHFVIVFDGTRATPSVTVHPYTPSEVYYRRTIIRRSKDERRVAQAKAWLDVRHLPYRDDPV